MMTADGRRSSSLLRKVVRAARGLAACTSLMVAVSAVDAQIIQNGSFEAPTIPDGTLLGTTPTSWSGGAVLMNPNAAGGFAGNPFLWPQAPDGQQYEDIGNTTSYALSQSFSIAVGGAYTLAWQDNTALAISPGFQTAPYSISLVDGSSQPVLSQSFDSYHANGMWQQRFLTPILAAGTYTLAFTSLNSANRTDTLIDAVSISAVPEAGSAWLLSFGLGGLALAVCRRRRVDKGI